MKHDSTTSPITKLIFMFTSLFFFWNSLTLVFYPTTLSEPDSQISFGPRRVSIQLLTDFTCCYGVSIVDFQQVTGGRVGLALATLDN